jgi:Neutral/alkaline non-lysosomal ceramidase, N-terminal
MTSESTATRLHVGIGRANITPAIGVDLMGYSRRSQPSTGVHMDMIATALVATVGSESVAILDCDLIYLHPPLIDEIRSGIAAFLGARPSHVLVNCTHSHSAPTSSPVKIGGEQDRVRPEEAAYIQSLPHLLLSAVKQALAQKVPARIAGGAGHAALSMNRRERLPDGRTVLGDNATGPIDHRVGIVRVDTLDGRPLAAIVNYACHPICIGSASRLISPDYPGPLRRVVERETGATCLFLQGATGNINPRSLMHSDPHEAERVGSILGLEAAKTFLGIETRHMVAKEEWITSVATFHLVRQVEAPAPRPDRIGAREQVLALPLSPLPDPEQARRLREDRRAALESLVAKGASPDDLNPARYQVMWTELLQKTIADPTRATEVRVPVQALHINDVAFAAIAGEIFVEIQLAIKEASPFPHTLVAGYSNGCVGYIPVASAYPEGGYEVDHSFKGYRLPSAIAPGGAERVIQTATDLLQSLHRARD